MTKFKKTNQGQQNNFRKKFNKFNKPGHGNNKNNGGKKEAGKKKKPAVNLVFDPDARKDFLTGFHKRKLEKKQHYKIKLQKQIQEEKQRIQAQVKKPAVYKSSSHAILPEVEALLAADDEDRNPTLNNCESFEVGSKTVIISSIDHSLHAPLNNTNDDNDSDEDEHELDLEEGDQETGSGNWKTKVNKKGKSKVIYKSDTNKLLQNSDIFKKIQKLKQKSKKGRPKPNPHFKPKVAPGTSTTSSNDSKNKGNSKNNLRRKGKQKNVKSKGRK